MTIRMRMYNCSTTSTTSSCYSWRWFIPIKLSISNITIDFDFITLDDIRLYKEPNNESFICLNETRKYAIKTFTLDGISKNYNDDKESLITDKKTLEDLVRDISNATKKHHKLALKEVSDVCDIIFTESGRTINELIKS